MTDQLVTYETAELAEQKGFNWMTSDDKWYDITGKLEVSFQGYKENLNSYRMAVPTQSLLQRWLREVHKLDLYCTPDYLNVVKNREKVYDCVCVKCKEDNAELLFHLNDFMTYEAALEKGLFEALKLI